MASNARMSSFSISDRVVRCRTFGLANGPSGERIQHEGKDHQRTAQSLQNHFRMIISRSPAVPSSSRGSGGQVAPVRDTVALCALKEGRDSARSFWRVVAALLERGGDDRDCTCTPECLPFAPFNGRVGCVASIDLDKQLTDRKAKTFQDTCNAGRCECYGGLINEAWMSEKRLTS